MLKRLRIENFKSFKDFEIEFDKFNCIVAPNNAGKSNLIESFRFLGYAIVDVKKAIEEFGGFDNIKNIFLNKKSIKFECEFFKKEILNISFRNRYIGEVIKGKRESPIAENFIEVFKSVNIKLDLEIFDNGSWVKKYYISGRFGKSINSYNQKELNNQLLDSTEVINSIKTYPFKIQISYMTEFEKDNIYKVLSEFGNEIIKKELIYIDYKNREDLLYALELESLINKDISISIGNSSLLKLEEYFYAYSFYPDIIKSSFKGGNTLRHDGTNLVEVLNFIKDVNLERFENISDSLIGIVEELNDIKIDKDLIDRNILLLGEKEKYLPFNIVSDGTINLLAILCAIFEPIQKSMISIDEIEKHLHLRAIDYILEVLKSEELQVVFTTQSTEILNNLNLKSDNLIFLYRDYEGFTKGLNSKKIPNFKKKVKRYRDISTIIRNEVLGYLGDFYEN